MNLTKLNELQMPTWRWLNMNHTDLELPLAIDRPYHNRPILGGHDHLSLDDSVTIEKINHLPADTERMQRFISEHQNYALTITIPAEVQLDTPLILNFILDEENPVLIDYLYINAESGSRADIIVNYRSSSSTPCFHGGFTYLHTAPDAAIRLFKIQMLGDQDLHLDTTAVETGDHGNSEVIYGELGGGQVVSSCNLSLAGTASNGHLDSLYLGSGRRRQDFNYRLELKGVAADGEITVKGALAGKSKKVLKSTLDFISGACDSKGKETETVLALSDQVLNLSAPLLLCGEDRVEGEHATSTGKPDEEKLFYLMSRGFSRQDAKRLLVEASFTPILNKIPVSELRQEIISKIREVVYHED